MSEITTAFFLINVNPLVSWVSNCLCVHQGAHEQSEISRKEKEDILEKLSQAERMVAEGRNRVNKLEDDNAKLRRALEQNMSRINRMSMDSDYFVDRLASTISDLIFCMS